MMALLASLLLWCRIRPRLALRILLAAVRLCWAEAITFEISCELSKYRVVAFLPGILPNLLGPLLFFQHGAKRIDSCLGRHQHP